VVEANWKIVGENYQECYHCPTIHPQLCRVSPPDSGENYRSSGGGAWSGGGWPWPTGRHHVSRRTSPSAPLRGLDAKARRRVEYLVVFPNVLLSLHPDYVMTHVLHPAGCRPHGGGLPLVLRPRGPRPGRRSHLRRGLLGRDQQQDWAACASVQRGLTSTDHRPGPLAPREDGVYQFVTMVARGYRGVPLGVDQPGDAL